MGSDKKPRRCRDAEVDEGGVRRRHLDHSGGVSNDSLSKSADAVQFLVWTWRMSTPASNLNDNSKAYNQS